MANANAAGIEIIGDSNPLGTSLGRNSDSLTGFNGLVTSQFKVPGGEGSTTLGSGLDSKVDTTFRGNVGVTFYSNGDVVTALKNLGVLGM